jgi:hypothetical protein
VLLGLFIMWPTPRTSNGITRWLPGGWLRFVPHDGHKEYSWHGADLVFGNYYVLTGLFAIALCAACLSTIRTPGPISPADPSVEPSKFFELR